MSYEWNISGASITDKYDSRASFFYKADLMPARLGKVLARGGWSCEENHEIATAGELNSDGMYVDELGGLLDYGTYWDAGGVNAEAYTAGACNSVRVGS